MIVVGPGRGEAYEVCVHKECGVHWGAEKRAKAARATSPGAESTYQKREAQRQAQYKREDEKRKAREQLWKKALPSILEAVAAKVRSIPIAQVSAELLAHANKADVRKAGELLKLKPAVPEEALRILLLTDLLVDDSDAWQINAFTKRVKSLLGVDVAGLLKKVQTSAQAQPTAKKAKAAKKR